MIGWFFFVILSLLAGIGWGLYLGERSYTRDLRGIVSRINEQTDRLFVAVERLIAVLPHAMSPWLKAAEGGATIKRRESAEGRTAYLASPEARDTLRKRIKEQHPELTDSDMDEAIQQINAQVMGARIGT